MKNILIVNSICISIIFILLGCQREDVTIQKIKSISARQYSSVDTTLSKLNYYYNTDADIPYKIESYFGNTLSGLNLVASFDLTVYADTIKVISDFTEKDGLDGIAYFKLNNKEIVTSDYVAVNKDANDVLLSMNNFTEVYYPVINIANYNYLFDGNNYTSFVFDYIFMVFSTPNPYKDTVDFSFTNLNYNPLAPLQNPYLANSLSMPFSGSDFTDIIYLLNTIGYTFFKPNTHLIDSYSSRTENRKAKYQYTFDSNNRLTKCKIYSPDLLQLFLEYDYTYE